MRSSKSTSLSLYCVCFPVGGSCLLPSPSCFQPAPLCAQVGRALNRRCKRPAVCWPVGHCREPCVAFIVVLPAAATASACCAGCNLQRLEAPVPNWAAAPRTRLGLICRLELQRHLSPLCAVEKDDSEGHVSEVSQVWVN